jgi:hypothetical protein
MLRIRALAWGERTKQACELPLGIFDVVRITPPGQQPVIFLSRRMLADVMKVRDTTSAFVLLRCLAAFWMALTMFWYGAAEA